MRKILLGVLAVLLVVAVCEAHEVREQRDLDLRPNTKSKRDSEVTCNFVDDLCKFLHKFRPDYKPSDNLLAERMKSFVKCYNEICESETTVRDSTHSKEYTKFCFMTEEEINGTRNDYLRKRTEELEFSDVTEYNVDVSVTRGIDYFSWVKNGAVTSVKDQGICGNCYTYAAVGAVEGAYQIKCGALYSFSTQQYTDCSYNYGVSTVTSTSCLGKVCTKTTSESWKQGTSSGNEGCNGGDFGACWAYNNMSSNALLLDECYPSTSSETGTEGSCQDGQSCKAAAYVGNYVRLPKNETVMLDALISQGPLACMLDADSISLYSDGIVSDAGGTVNHAVLVVGYGTDVGSDGTVTPYWIVKNSWGTYWGNNGYFFLEFGINACNIGNCAYPILSQC